MSIEVKAPQEGQSFDQWGGTYGRNPSTGTFTTAGPVLDATRTLVRVRVATDDWGPIQEISPSGKRLNDPQLRPIDVRAYENISPQHIQERGSLLAFTMGWPQNQDDFADFEIWAVDKGGKRHNSGGVAAPKNNREFEFALPLASVHPLRVSPTPVSALGDI
ncbi:MAG: hypothetical protein WKF77_27410 [Planctomycetaceae bacterium]